MVSSRLEGSVKTPEEKEGKELTTYTLSSTETDWSLKGKVKFRLWFA